MSHPRWQRGFYRRHTKTDAIDAEVTARLPVVDPALRVRGPAKPAVDAILRHVRLVWRLRSQIAARKKRILDRATMVYPGYENVKPNTKYPSILFITETTDDRVTPIWARMMAAKMEDQDHDVLFNEAAGDFFDRESHSVRRRL